MRYVCLLLTVYWVILLVRILLSWFPLPSSAAARRVFELIYALTEPVLRPLRGLLPPLRLGAVALDLSPIVVFIVIQVLRASIC
ncbi:MAG TPA: YggT family protein [Actinomycetota bacterium]|nr:YggT family protein [Actinomycetota bacterium]